MAKKKQEQTKTFELEPQDFNYAIVVFHNKTRGCWMQDIELQKIETLLGTHKVGLYLADLTTVPPEQLERMPFPSMVLTKFQGTGEGQVTEELSEYRGIASSHEIIHWVNKITDLNIPFELMIEEDKGNAKQRVLN